MKVHAKVRDDTGELLTNTRLAGLRQAHTAELVSLVEAGLNVSGLRVVPMVPRSRLAGMSPARRRWRSSGRS